MIEARVRTLNTKEAALFLKIHSVTLTKKAASGEIQAAKIGKCWVFLEVDLIAYIRSKYQMRALLSDDGKGKLCHFTNVRTHRFGGSKSVLADNSQYNVLLGLKTKSKPKNSTTG